ncbi:BREX system ATP-binding protein BrxD [Planomonospora parontospora]|uniref:BREX system ATP-binding protein BrxD n=1 Tax=Planomonospora parontospora TaxID=58119 RepID=UPI00167033F5|nr:BREX system ATP-binding protein BrxD [Planomonospora parontospora]GGL56714.1 ATP-binding protein [Planomonospora parontospora subsp. antibiotica]GII19976.1 ATP-binding protein [Planomonospora parontospora subsp. antibiotica]
MTRKISRARRRQIIDALGRGTVPQTGLDVFAVGLERFEKALDDDLSAVTAGGGGFKAVRGEYGSGKTFFARWLAERAKRRGMATSELQISQRETPLHRLETVYRRLIGGLSTTSSPPSALREIVDSWLFSLEEHVIATGKAAKDDRRMMAAEVERLIESRLAEVSRNTPAFATALRFYRQARLTGEQAIADGLLAWVSGEPHVAATVRRYAMLKGELDSRSALGFLQGLLVVLRDCGHPGLLVVLDEIETLQRLRSDVREQSLNTLRQLIDEIDKGRFPGLYLVITGTPAFYDGQQGVQRLTPLAQRLATDFGTDARFDTARAVQIRLTGFDRDKLVELGCAVRDLYAQGDPQEDRIRSLVDDGYIKELAAAVAGELGVGTAPRVFLRKLVADVLYRVTDHEDFHPRKDYKLTVSDVDLTDEERNAVRGVRRAASADEVELDLT